jgi:hypothetical protein
MRKHQGDKTYKLARKGVNDRNITKREGIIPWQITRLDGAMEEIYGGPAARIIVHGESPID